MIENKMTGFEVCFESRFEKLSKSKEKSQKIKGISLAQYIKNREKLPVSDKVNIYFYKLIYKITQLIF
jgi:hypothetical protein